MRLFTQEAFGPVCAVLPVNGDEQAIGLANDSPYGLTAGVLTEDVGRGYQIARRLQTGIVHVNDQTVDDEPQAPFGGVKDSGYGRFEPDPLADRGRGDAAQAATSADLAGSRRSTTPRTRSTGT